MDCIGSIRRKLFLRHWHLSSKVGYLSSLLETHTAYNALATEKSLRGDRVQRVLYDNHLFP